MLALMKKEEIREAAESAMPKCCSSSIHFVKETIVSTPVEALTVNTTSAESTAVMPIPPSKGKLHYYQRVGETN